ncbi:MAG: 30S ribosomal protein S16 [Patescibacteria group bacterium]
MLAIKLRQIGKKHQKTFRIVVAEKRSKMSAVIDDLGFWNPHTNKFEIKKEKVEHWLKNGAQPTDSVHNILINAKAIEGKKIPMHKTPVKTEETPKPETTPETASVA